MTEPYESGIASALVSRIAAGDAEAEAEMVQRYDRGLRFMLRHRAKNPDIANDVAQETWHIVLGKIRANEIEEPEKLAAFIVNTGKNQLIMYFRKYKNAMATPEQQAELAVADTPESILENHNYALLVRQVLNELNIARDRELLCRVYLNGQEKQLVCDSLDLSPAHFDRVLFRARQRFRQLWQYLQNGSPPP